ncbi:hypothetical protein F4677DRAFT_448993 [Hypoxylon crocopeplum]|nr:hypothetical protein F4677DRAFT_448993 [Hypoxylon crocopeplum]
MKFQTVATLFALAMSPTAVIGQDVVVPTSPNNAILERDNPLTFMKCLGEQTPQPWIIGNTALNKQECYDHCGCVNGSVHCLSIGQASQRQVEQTCKGTARSQYACRCLATPGCKRGLAGRQCRRDAGIAEDDELEAVAPEDV